jgi:modification methylase
VLTDRQRRWRAIVGADGSLSCGRVQGSIHGVGAAVQEAPSCNGWVFWHVEQKDGGLRLLDLYRAEALAAS